MTAWLLDLWPYAVALVNLVRALGTSLHAVVYKRETRAVIAWVGLIWLAPLVGALLYILFGVNRIRRQAQALRAGRGRAVSAPLQQACAREDVARVLGVEGTNLQSQVHLVGRVTDRPLLAGNHVTCLVNGDEAYPAMLEAIERAHSSIALCTYIFDNDRAGRMFVAALGRAVARGVDVRVLVDDVGARYTWPSILRPLRRAGVRVARFLPTLGPRSVRFSNLRTHRKLLVVDGRTGFTGGMNIREGNLVAGGSRHPVQDLHFCLEGPVVAELMEVFARDWAFSAQESLEDERWFPPIASTGPVLARAVPDGPDDDFDTLPLTLLGAISAAQRSLSILTPYFLPDEALVKALGVAALRGVEVRILLPEKGNLPLVQWASTAMLWQVLEHGCRLWRTPPPFDHGKLMIVDDMWALIGSANWDPRSLRLNFELNVELYHREFAADLQALFERKRAAGREITLEEVDGRPLPVRVRDGIARLASPYL